VSYVEFDDTSPSLHHAIDLATPFACSRNMRTTGLTVLFFNVKATMGAGRRCMTTGRAFKDQRFAW
jgi:hypothetical protein